jgi:hypothetical protein
MGNRAVITFAPYSGQNVGVYVHWNGGRPSIEGYLKACRDLGYRTPGEDRSYAMARLIGVITTFHDGGLSVGVDICDRLDTNNLDNGTYLIGDSWEIVGKAFEPEDHEPVNPDAVTAIAECITGRIKAQQGAG